MPAMMTGSALSIRPHPRSSVPHTAPSDAARAHGNSAVAKRTRSLDATTLGGNDAVQVSDVSFNDGVRKARLNSDRLKCKWRKTQTSPT